MPFFCTAADVACVLDAVPGGTCIVWRAAEAA